MENKLVLLHIDNRIAQITINRPEKKNALNPELVTALNRVFISIENNPLVKVVVLKANGDVFSAGADLAYMQQLAQNSFDENLEDSNRLKNLFYTIFNCTKITIAQVEGHAIAGGCGLVSVCDIVFAVPEAKFGYTEVKLGFVPAIVSCFLTPKIGDMLTRKLLLSGELFTANQAMQYNLISFVINGHEINQKVNDFALNLCSQTAGGSLTATKKLINQNNFDNLEAKLERAVHINAKIRTGEEFKKGLAAFINKQPNKW